MADIRDIRTQNGTPKSIWSVQNGRRKECKKIIEIKNGVAKVVWLTDGIADMWQYTVKVNAGQKISLSVSTQGLNDTFDWGDGSTSIGYVNSHTYEKAGTYTISFTDIGKSNLFYASTVSPSTALRKIIHPSYCTKLYISSAENLEEIDFILPTSITYVEHMGGGSCGIKKLKIPEGVNTIKDNSISYMPKMQEITLPKTLTTIGSDAFYKSQNLKGISIPDGVTFKGTNHFSYCSNLNYINFPTDLKSIPDYFCYLSGLTSLTFPTTIKETGRYSFYGCYKLAKINIPEGVEKISSGCFDLNEDENTSLTSLEFPSTLTTIEDYAFDGASTEKGYTAVKSLYFPDNVTSIGSSAFARWTGLEQLTIGAGIQYIGYSAFSGADKLKSCTILGYPRFLGYNFVGYDSNGDRIEGFKIYGKTGSGVESYAQNNGFEFIAI